METKEIPIELRTESRETGRMKSKTLLRLSPWKTRSAGALVLAFAGSLLLSQAAPGRFVGTITAINGDTLTVKPDNGDVQQVEIPSTAVLKRVEPGQKD